MFLLTSSESAVWELALLSLRGVCPKIMPAYTFPDLKNPQIRQDTKRILMNSKKNKKEGNKEKPFSALF